MFVFFALCVSVLVFPVAAIASVVGSGYQRPVILISGQIAMAMGQLFGLAVLMV